MTDHPDVTLAKYDWPVPMIFVRYLDPTRLGFVEDGSDGEVADCVVGVRGAEGEMLFMTAVASRLEPWKYE